jgi:hypothetical protein
MTSPQYPYLPPPQHLAGPGFRPVHPPQHPAAPSFRPVHPPRQRSLIDIIITSVMSAFAVLAASGTLWYSLFFAMATDSCATQCNDAVLGSAYLVTWGGVATAAVAAVAGIVIAAKRGWVMWVWPTAASVMIVAALVIGVYLANSVIHHG